jgi:hypothetical protein
MRISDDVGWPAGGLERYRFAKKMVDKTNAIGGTEGSRGRVCGKYSARVFLVIMNKAHSSHRSTSHSQSSAGCQLSVYEFIDSFRTFLPPLPNSACPHPSLPCPFAALYPRVLFWTKTTSGATSTVPHQCWSANWRCLHGYQDTRQPKAMYSQD